MTGRRRLPQSPAATLRFLGGITASAVVVAGVLLAADWGDRTIPVLDVPISSSSRGGVMRVERAVVDAGDPFSVTFHAGERNGDARADMRGIAYELTPINNPAASTYTLFSDKNPHGPGVARHGDGPIIVVLPALSGPGPDTVPTPADAVPGRYVLCVRDDDRCATVALR